MPNVLTTAQSGERWDQVSFRAYGDPMLYRGIIAANPKVGITDRLAGGTVLIIPVLPAGQPATSNSNLLPPWLTP